MQNINLPPEKQRIWNIKFKTLRIDAIIAAKFFKNKTYRPVLTHSDCLFHIVTSS